jgi:hypothetical protein
MDTICMNFTKTILPKILAFIAILLCANTWHIASAQLAANPDSPLIRKPIDTSGGVSLSAKTVAKTKKNYFDSSFSPHKATVRSALIPGWGQVYNRQIWKVPLVYGAIGTTAGIFIYNLKNYRDLRRSYILLTDGDPTNDYQVPNKFSVLSVNSIKFYRDDFRRNVDYSVLAFLIAWGLNVVDATVSAHLRQFDVSDDLSLKVKPTLSPTGNLGIGLAVNF